MLIFAYIFPESSTVKSVKFHFKLKTISQNTVWYSVAGMCLKAKSRFLLLDRSFFAKIYLLTCLHQILLHSLGYLYQICTSSGQE